ncbi:hypothetical protein BpHYR1_036709 [Brachionus plicatilis]|uniref:Uncharacterized protein n=1 Tax=Brachionus plicatilis TaxID=10195 RepID=A0A3M7QYU3_BRAPC|nr:hypothetical protein BpHYR1_036709 [Brachionus plicatilis]
MYSKSERIIKSFLCYLINSLLPGLKFLKKLQNRITQTGTADFLKLIYLNFISIKNSEYEI